MRIITNSVPQSALQNHMEQIIAKLSGAYRAVSLIIHISNITTFSSFNVLSFCYEIVTNFWGNTFNCGDIFIVQEKIIKIVAGERTRASCVSLFKKLEILLVTCQYRPLLSLMNLVVSNQENVQTKSSIYSIGTQNIYYIMSRYSLTQYV